MQPLDARHKPVLLATDKARISRTRHGSGGRDSGCGDILEDGCRASGAVWPRGRSTEPPAVTLFGRNPASKHPEHAAVSPIETRRRHGHPPQRTSIANPDARVQRPHEGDTRSTPHLWPPSSVPPMRWRSGVDRHRASPHGDWSRRRCGAGTSGTILERLAHGFAWQPRIRPPHFAVLIGSASSAMPRARRRPAG